MQILDLLIRKCMHKCYLLKNKRILKMRTFMKDDVIDFAITLSVLFWCTLYSLADRVEF